MSRTRHLALAAVIWLPIIGLLVDEVAGVRELAFSIVFVVLLLALAFAARR